MKRPALIGIVNVTPDSFSGDGRMGAAAVAHAHALVLAGADILDIGAESTRPGALAMTDEQEWERLAPVLRGISEQSWRADVRISVDTRHALTASRALALGVDIINDVGGLKDHTMLEVLSGSMCDCAVMHELGLPADASVTLPEGTDMVAALLMWKEAVTDAAQRAGIVPERLIHDPGIGFGKTPAQSLELILGAGALVASGGRWLYGHSRKSFLKLFTDAPADARDELTRGFSVMLAAADVPYLRVHDVAGQRALFERLCLD